MNIKLLICLLAITGMVFLNSCGSEEKKPELEKVDSDDLINGMDTANKQNPIIQNQDTIAPKDTIAVKDNTKTNPVKTEPVKPVDNAAKPLMGSVVSLVNLLSGGNGKVSGAEAQAFTGKGGILVFLADNGTVYFVYNEDGTFGSKRLAKYADNPHLGITGKSKVVDGVNIFIMSSIEAM